MKLPLAILALLPLAASADTQAAELDRLEGDAVLGAELGNAVALSGGRALASAPYDDELGQSAGAVFVYEEMPDRTWGRVAKLLAPDGEGGDRFGLTSVSLSGDRALIGVPFDDVGAAFGTDAGTARVFERQPDGSWIEVASLRHPTVNPAGGFELGWAVDLDEDRALVGAPGEVFAPTVPFSPDSGAAHVFERQANGTWSAVARLVPSDPVPGANFGASVGLCGERAVVGARFADAAASAAGAVYVFEEQANGSWEEVAKLVETGGAFLNQFGLAVDLDDERILVGTGVESAYVFERFADGTWAEEGPLTAGPTGAAGDCFGCTVALAEERALVGAPREDGAGSDRGVAHAFARRPDGSWARTARIMASDGGDGDQLGSAVALQDDRAVVGARLADGIQVNQGATYVFDVEPLSGDVEEVPSSGGVQRLEVDAGRPHGGRVYTILGTTNGTSPGMALGGGLTLPLNGGSYFRRTMSSPDPPLIGAIGTLAASGHADASFVLAPTDFALMGETLHHAFLVVDATGMATFVSNALPVHVAPGRVGARRGSLGTPRTGGSL